MRKSYKCIFSYAVITKGIKQMYKWAAVVYGRTYEVDFRFIAVPEGFTSEDRGWLWNHIRATLRSAEKLPGNPRWSLFANGRYCVVGVTCMAKDLVGATEDAGMSEDMTRDFQGRPLYLFTGYVAELDKQEESLPIPQYCENDIQLFKPLYRYIAEQRLVKSFHPASKVPVPSEYRELDYSQFQGFPTIDGGSFSLNSDPQKVTLWSDSEENRSNLWMAASRSITSQYSPTSLCLGLGGQKDVVDSLFLNATATDVRQQQTISRATQSPVLPTPIPSQEEPSAAEEPAWSRRSQVPLPSESESTGWGIQEALDAFLGATIASRVAGLSGGLIGVVIGWIAGGFLINKGIGGTIAKKVRHLFNNSTGQEADGEIQTRSPSSLRTRQQSVYRREPGYGFRQKRQPSSSKQSENSQSDDQDWF